MNFLRTCVGSEKPTTQESPKDQFGNPKVMPSDLISAKVVLGPVIN